MINSFTHCKYFTLFANDCGRLSFYISVFSAAREHIARITQNHDKFISPKSSLSLLLFLFMSLIPHSVPLYKLFPSLYLNMQPFAQGDSIFSTGKMYAAYLLPSYHQTVKKHLLQTKPFAYLCTHNWFSVISPAKCHWDNWALQHGWYETLTEVW